MKWQPIETAPEWDGKTTVLVWGGRHRVEVTLSDGEWWRDGCPEDVAPTHWMPLPDPPK